MVKREIKKGIILVMLLSLVHWLIVVWVRGICHHLCLIIYLMVRMLAMSTGMWLSPYSYKILKGSWHLEFLRRIPIQHKLILQLSIFEFFLTLTICLSILVSDFRYLHVIGNLLIALLVPERSRDYKWPIRRKEST